MNGVDPSSAANAIKDHNLDLKGGLENINDIDGLQDKIKEQLVSNLKASFKKKKQEVRESASFKKYERLRDSIAERAEVIDQKLDKFSCTKAVKDKCYKFFNTPMITFKVNGVNMDSPKVWEKGSCCPNPWVIPTYIMKTFIIFYVLTNFYTIGNIKTIQKEMFDYNSTAPIPANHPFREACSKLKPNEESYLFYDCGILNQTPKEPKHSVSYYDYHVKSLFNKGKYEGD